jgi:hypothetical protein
MADIKDRAREYLAKHSEYSEVFGGTFIAVDTFTAMVDFAEQETKELKALNKELQCCANCRHSYGGEEEPYHDCGYCHAMNCICKLKLKEHTSDIYRMWEDKCEHWEMRVN